MVWHKHSNISDEDKEWIEQTKKDMEYKNAVDLQSKMVDARRDSKYEGSNERALAIVQNMLRRNRPIDEIVEDTGVTREEVEELLDSLTLV